MKTKVSLTLLLLFTVLDHVVTAQGIRFEKGDWASVKAKAKAENKPIFVDAYTTWCGPCKAMDKNVFVKESVGNYFNSTFINYKMDMEKGEGIDFAKQYEVNAFPTLLYFDSRGNLIYKAVGAKDEAGLLEQAKLALNPEFQLASYKKEYEESGKTLSDLLTYINKLRQSGSFRTATELASDYFSKMENSERFTTDAWRLLTGYIGDYKSEAFEFVLKNKKEYEAVAGEDKVNEYIFNVLAIRFVPGTRGADSKEVYYGTLEKYRQYVPVDYFIARMKYFEHLNGPDDSLYHYAKNLFDKEYDMIQADDKLAYYRIYVANRYIEESGEKFQSALRWARLSAAEDEKDYKPAFVLAQLLYKEGNYKESLAWAEKAQTAFGKTTEAPAMQRLFRADSIESFIAKVKEKL